MNPLVLKDPGLHLMLLAIDEELAADTRALGCRQCGEKRKECVTASARAIRQIHIESPLRLARNSQSVRIKQGFKWCPRSECRLIATAKSDSRVHKVGRGCAGVAPWWGGGGRDSSTWAAVPPETPGGTRAFLGLVPLVGARRRISGRNT